jgi:hypothetical protein
MIVVLKTPAELAAIVRKVADEPRPLAERGALYQVIDLLDIHATPKASDAFSNTHATPVEFTQEALAKTLEILLQPMVGQVYGGAVQVTYNPLADDEIRFWRSLAARSLAAEDFGFD